MTNYIEREALINAIATSTEPFTTGLVFRAINNQPAADVAPVRRGHWIKCGYACGKAEFECSLCGEIEWRTNETDYCPNCGADMREVPNDD